MECPVLKGLLFQGLSEEEITRLECFPGELFGMEALAERLYPLTAVTLRDCEICAADREEFSELLRGNPEICLGMVRFLVSEISRVRSQVTDMSFKDARMKVATFLLSLVSSETDSPSYPYALNLPFSRQEISEILELSPETVSRTLGLLRRDHTIEARGRRLTIFDIEALRAAAHR
jgi:CRP/FNR family transcriptional regulator